ncbi:ATP-binding protein [Pseudomonas aeruginosa]|uniref:ATP-binding protein n=1 Tax=Pseudomonas aeruginosa TaxID=287 RepID=UPI0003B984E7|nr:ATP-binding protein [Pseudomonas aeruginosa]AVE36528.1 ATP-binding protein [Pseudomonas aeruginosa]AYZ58148.1 ATP-binding protein [Pseudomonas aeruginosa]AYZ58403.1 ATP-binding protein [Pseudomonas aeruginosa]AYZ59982.1 ATP-binding protein [Pseudomonas aeruginosa]EIU2545771.1 ATP-binding protein [Pseudomonas aeruginosa]
MTEEFQRGVIPLARYQEQQLPEYQDNPLISALPPIPDLQEVVGLLQQLPGFEPQEALLDGRLRAHAIARLLHGFFQPLSHHLELESKISLMIRQGYIGRNPASGAWYAHLQNGYRRVEEEDLDAAVYQSVSSTANSLSLFGCSGCGKTRTLERILGMYPQALHHPDYNITQLVYLKVDCPIDGDLDELCLSFFNEVDKILGTHYSRSHGRKKLGTKRLLASMCQVANLHALGVLIIDEVQNLNEARSGGAEKMHNFFVSLVNTIGVPIIQVGTHRASKFFQRTFRAARRVSGLGSIRWDRLPRDEHWKRLLKRLWKYQWLRNAAPLDDELEATMYDLTQGVMDIVIKLFALAQIRAIVTGVECIKPLLLRRVFEDEFKPVHPMLAALRSGRPELIAKYDDLLMPEIEGRLLTLTRSLDSVAQPKPPAPPADDKAKRLAALLEGMEIPRDIAIPMADELLAENPDIPLAALIHKATAYLAQDAPKRPGISRVKRTEWGCLSEEDLRRRYADGPESEAYDRFKQAGLILDLRPLLRAS